MTFILALLFVYSFNINVVTSKMTHRTMTVLIFILTAYVQKVVRVC